MPESFDAPLSRSASDADSITMRQYVDLMLARVTADVAARREGMEAEQRSYRASLAASDAQWRSMHEKVHEELEKGTLRDKEMSKYIWETAQDSYKTAHIALERDVEEVRTGAAHALRDAVNDHAQEHARQREADVLADRKLDIRLESMNGLRAQITAAQQNSVSRDQLDDRTAAVTARVDATQTAFSQTVQRLEAAIVDLQTSRATAAGRATALSTMIGIGTFIISVSVAVLLHYIH